MAKKKKNERRFSVIHADAVAPKPISWLLEDVIGQRIPKGNLTLIAGSPGEGKSTFANFLVAEAGKRGVRSLLSNVEDMSAFIRLKLEAQGADAKQVDLPEEHPIFPTDYAPFADYVRQEDVGLIILDPVANHFRVSIYQDQECRQAMTPLRKLAEETGAAIVFLHHTTETGALKVKRGAHPLAAIGGGRGGLVGGCRAVYVFGTNPYDEDERVLAHVKSNCGADTSSIVMSGSEDLVRIPGQGAHLVVTLELEDTDADVSARQVLAPETISDHRKPAKREAAVGWLTEYLCLGPQPVTELYEDAVEDGHSKATIRRASKDLGVETRRLNEDGTSGAFGPGSRIFWALPDGHAALLDEDDAGTETVACCDDPDVDGPTEKDEYVCLNCKTVVGVQTNLDDLDEEFAGLLGEGGGGDTSASYPWRSREDRVADQESEGGEVE